MKDNERSGMIEKDSDVMLDIHGRGYEGLQVDSGQEQTPLQQKLDDFGNLLAKVLMGFVSQMSKDVRISLCFTSRSTQDDSWMLIRWGSPLAMLTNNNFGGHFRHLCTGAALSA